MGLINGSRWMKLRAEFGPTFHYPVVIQKTASISNFACQYVEQMTTQPAPDGTFRMQAAEAVSRFPFFYTATHLYGTLSADEKDRLWVLGQRSYKLMGYVLSGGCFRFAFSRLIQKKAASELAQFCQLWAQFNNDMYQSRTKMSPQPPIVSAWQQVVDGEVTQEEVSQDIYVSNDPSLTILGSPHTQRNTLCQPRRRNRYSLLACHFLSYGQDYSRRAQGRDEAKFKRY